MPEDEARAQHETILAALSDVEGHMHKRIELMSRALTRATGNGELQIFDQPRVEYSEAQAGPLFEAAWGGDPDAIAALCLIASRLLWRGVQLPPMLAATMSHVLAEQGNSKPKRGRGKHSPYDNVTRDLAIIRRIQTVCDEQNLSPTRNDAEKDPDEPTVGKPSGCSVVAYELRMKERAVEEIWGNRKNYGIP